MTSPPLPVPSDTIKSIAHQASNYRIPENRSPWYSDEDSTILLTRIFGSETLEFRIQKVHFGGETNHAVLERDKTVWTEEGLNRVEQLSTTVLCFKGIPTLMKDKFKFPLQPLVIEFMDSEFNTLRQVDVWSERPYQELGDRITSYYEYDTEHMGVIPYTKQVPLIEPDRYTMFTHIRSEGNHVIVNYELRGLKNMEVVNVQHTLHVYDLKGQLKQVVKLPSVDGAVVSNDGAFMMYTYGGIGLANTGNPFATIDTQGWALMKLKEKTIVLQEDINSASLAFNRLFIEGKFIRLAYSNPATNDSIYDYHVFFDMTDHTIYSKQWVLEEWERLREEWRQLGITDWMYYIKKYHFKSVLVSQN